jgi:putative transposase
MADASEGFSTLADRLRPFQSVESKWGLEDRLGRMEYAASQKKPRASGTSYGIIDSQSVKTQYDSDDRGIDGGKKGKGRKRHIVVDILGHLRHVQVHAANRHDTVSGGEVLRRAAEKHPTLRGYPAHKLLTRS